MWVPFQTAAPVPRDIESVISIRHDNEAEPRELGVDLEARERIWDAVRRWYGSGIHPAIQICVRRNGGVLLDRAIGYSSGNGPDGSDEPAVLATPATPFNAFSASKAVTAMVIHLLDQERVLHLDDHVCEHIPEFASHKKEWITIRHLLTHRAGIPNVPPQAMRLEQLEDPAGILRLICDAKPIAHPGRQVTYHALTSGFVLAEVVRRTTGKSVGEVLRARIGAPLGMTWFHYGVRRDQVEQVARNYTTGLPALFPISAMLKRALGVGHAEATVLSNDARYLTTEIPSGNLVATAEELSRFYQLLLNGGELGDTGIFEARTVKRAVAEQSYFEIDAMLGMPFRYSMGFMLGAQWFSMYGPDTEHAFGHLGFTNIISWADPERQVAAAIMTNGKPVLYPALYNAWDVLRQIGLACTREGARPLRQRVVRGTNVRLLKPGTGRARTGRAARAR